MPKVSPHLLAGVVACLATGLASAQDASSTHSVSGAAGASAPVAYVYVSSRAGSRANIYAYAASSTGLLTAVPGSPLAAPVQALALNGKWLFGSNSGPGILYSYSIAANGSIHQADSYDASANTGPSVLFLDHTGASLYAGFSDGVGDNGYESLSINQTNGKLTPVNADYTGVGQFYGLTFISNNKFGYGASCYHFDPVIYGFARLNGGGLSSLGISPALPAAPAGEQYCPTSAIAADPYNDVVVPVYQFSAAVGRPDKYQLAVYTADQYGKLTTTSTSANMAAVQVEPDYVAMSQKGFYLAAGGTGQSPAVGPGGLQVFLMHGSKPPTALTGVVNPGIYVNQMFWDNNEHLYVVSSAASKLYVFSVSTSGVKQIVGSPYSIPSPSGLIVLPK